MHAADAWYICRIGFVETFRAVGLAAGASATRVTQLGTGAFSETAGRLAGMEIELGALLGGHGVELRNYEDLSRHFRGGVRASARLLYAA